MLPKTAEYALRAMVCLARPPQLAVSADVIAEQTRVPRAYLHRVLQGLTAAGLVESRPGPGGGYELAKPPAKVTILDVVNAVEPVERIRNCPLGLSDHTILCPLHRELDKAYAAMEAAFRKVTLASLVKSTSRAAPLCDVGPKSSSDSAE